MTVEVLLDTGPLVALLDAKDDHHRWAVEAFDSVPEVLTTCEAVVAEACFLLAPWPRAIDAIFQRIVQKKLKLESMIADAQSIHFVMKKYRNLPASYADACLVRLSERYPRATVLTIDSDFEIYRRGDRAPIPLLRPQGG